MKVPGVIAPCHLRVIGDKPKRSTLNSLTLKH
jgi:hypothetical protein